MEGYREYAARRRDFTERFTEFQIKRLKGDVALAGFDAATDTLVDEVVQLEQKAKKAAGEGKVRQDSSSTSASRSTLDRVYIEKLIATATRGPRYNDGFITKQQIKREARGAQDALRPMLRLFAPEIERIRTERAAARAEMVTAQAAQSAELARLVAAFAAETGDFVERIGAPALPLDHPSWQDTDWTDGAGLVRAGDAFRLIGGQQFVHPFLMRLPGQNLFVYSKTLSGQLKNQINGLLLRGVRAAAPGRLRLVLIDPTSLGNTFAPLLSLGAHSDAVITTKVWTGEADIRQRLEEESDRVGLIIQKYLTDEFATLEDYNRAAGEVSEEGVVIAINDFPLGLDQRSLDIVKSLVEVGPRCGVSVVIMQADSIPGERAEICNEISKSCVQMGHWTVADYFPSHYGAATTVSIGKDLFDRVGSFLDVFEHCGGESARWTRGEYKWIAGGGSRGWHLSEIASWDADVAEGVLESASRRFAAGARVEVRLDQVWDLFARQRGSRKQIRFGDENCVWAGSSANELIVPVGRHG